jgi:hypothetical protein
MSTGWTTVDEYQAVAGRQAIPRDVEIDSDGVAYVTGDASDGIARLGALRVRAPGATEWSTSTFRLDAAGQMESSFWGAEVVEWTDAAGIRHKDLYAAGQGSDSSGERWWVVAKSPEKGGTWETVDKYKLPGSTGSAEPREIAVAADGDLYVAGTAYDASGVSHSIVRRLDASASQPQWSTVDDVVLRSGNHTRGAGVVSTASGVYVLGSGIVPATTRNGSATRSWFVRRSSDGGNTWSTCDLFNAGGTVPLAMSIAADGAGNLFAVGGGTTSTKSGSYEHWVVRKANPDGTGWATVDSSPRGGSATDVATGPGGEVYVVGWTSGSDKTSTSHFITRRSADGGATWQTSDDYVGPGQTSTGSSAGNAVAVDADGNVIAAGNARASSSTGSRWMVRELKVVAPTTVFSNTAVTTADDSTPITTQILA